MSEFINTIDVLGDDVVVDSIIQRTITEFKDDQVTVVGSRAFYGCSALETVDLPNASNVEAFSFMNCTALKSVNIPTATDISTKAFCGCSALETVDLPNAITIAANAFTNCAGLVSVNIPKVTVIGPEVFLGCSALSSIELPCVTTLSARVIGGTSITSICIPKVKMLSAQEFKDAGKLEKIDAPILESFKPDDVWLLNGVKTLILRNTEKVCALRNSPTTFMNGDVYVPKTMDDGSDGVASYRAATNWSSFAGNIYAIEDYPEICGG